LANNETGVVQPLDGLRDAAKAGGHFLHVDAAQALGRVPVSFRECGADLMTLSAHKMGGIAGCGVLLMRDGLSIAAQVNGGGQELGRRSGTENIAGIAAFGAAAKWAHEHHEDWQRLGALRDAMESEIMSAVPDAVIHSAGTARLPNTSMSGLPGVSGETQVMAMDLAGFAVSSGAACSSGKVKVSHVLAAMGASHPGDAIRISLGPSNTQDEVKRFTAAWIGFARQALMRRAPGKAA
jgi:cysteine desulfurase